MSKILGWNNAGRSAARVNST